MVAKLASGYAARPAPGLSRDEDRSVRRQLRSSARRASARRRNRAETAWPGSCLVAGVAAESAQAEIKRLRAAFRVGAQAGAERQDGRHRSRTATELRLHVSDAASAEAALPRGGFLPHHGRRQPGQFSQMAKLAGSGAICTRRNCVAPRRRSPPAFSRAARLDLPQRPPPSAVFHRPARPQAPGGGETQTEVIALEG